ncbi:MAG: ABC transporter ATP-binding protein [Epsilonproteobacteria bacterium]|nr:ABC transporter ATP-binding protein [Campylobacterota bacterium]
MSQTVAAIEARALSFDYAGYPALENVTFRVEEGDFLAVIGPNGGGKSTLLKLLLGVLKPTAGTVLLYGRPPQKADVSVGYVPQETGHNVDFPVTVGEVVAMGLLRTRTRWRRYSKEDEKRSLSALARVGMAEFLDRRIGELSGGERQRVLIARALAGEPKILMLDEPTASIDFSGQHEIFELLAELNQTMTVVVVSHDMSMVMGYARHALYVNKTALMHEIDAHTRYQIKKQLSGENGHYCGAEFWRDLGRAITCTKACEDA